MSQPSTGLHIQAQSGNEFYRRLAAFAYLSCLTHGIGAVVIAEVGFTKGKDGAIEADARYVPYSADNAIFTAEAEGWLNAYDPAQELVLLIVDAKDRATCVQMTAQLIGATPKRLCEEWVKGELAMPWLPGQLLSLDEPDAGLAAGHYVFVWRDGATLLMRRVEVSDYDGLEATGEILRIHLDFADSFRANQGINLFAPDTVD